MALKRVSDLPNRKKEDITTYINNMYEKTSSNKDKLPFSKIEVSEINNNDTSKSQHTSYAYDILALSSIFTDGILQRDISFNNNKTFNNNVTIKGLFKVSNNDNNLSTEINTEKLYLWSQTTTDIRSIGQLNLITNNNMQLNSNTNLNISVANNITTTAKNGNITTTANNGNISLNANNDTITLSGNKIVINFKESFTINRIDASGGVHTALVISNNNNTTKTNFPQSSVNNPINGCINKALWS